MTSSPKFIDAGSSGEWGWHATELAMKCPQAFAYAHRVKWQGAGAPSEDGGEEATALPTRPSGGEKAALHKGSLLHQALAHYYSRKKDELAGVPTRWATPTDAIDWLAAKIGPAAAAHVPLIKGAMRAYESYYLTEKLTPLHIEEVFSAEVNGYRFTQRLDLVARDASGKVVIIDHKSTAVINNLTEARYALSGQFLGMATFGREIFGREFGGVVLNLIEMQERGGVMGFDFKRAPIAPAPNALRLFPLTIRHARERIAELDRAGLDPWEWPKVLSETTCVTSYGKCEWFECCRWGNVKGAK
jgi:hypothetical protein